MEKKEPKLHMQYRKDQKGTDLSVLGYGCMRFTKKYGKIVFEKAEREVMTAIRRGVNYFDTAYIYPGSEECLGKILEKNGCRDRVYIATKLPHYLIKSREGLEKCFQTQLRRLRTDHVDYYLMHMLTDIATWERLKGMGIQEWIQEKLDSGQIRNIGFSYHGNADMFCRLADAYPWNFCQIQYNYMDENTQAGRKGLLYAAEKGLPVIVMEPLRGGRLVNLLPQEAKEAIEKAGQTPAGLAFRWLWDQPQVTVVLSGMNSRQMVKENTVMAAKSYSGMMGAEEQELVRQVKKLIDAKIKIGCTGCGYCMPCPKGVDIPGTFSAWNMFYSQDRRAARKSYMQCTVFRHDPSSASQCVGCGKCEQHCPQRIEIRRALKEAAADLETPAYRGVRGLIRLLHLW